MQSHHGLEIRTQIWTVLLFIIVSILKTEAITYIPGIVDIREYAGAIPTNYDISMCNNVTSRLGNGVVHEIETYGNCINLYSEPNCGGVLIRFQPGRVFSSINKLNGHRWENDSLVAGESMIVKSLGPCYDRCDPRNSEGAKDDPVKITVYGDEDYAGPAFSLDLKGDDCMVLPFRTRNRESIKISGDPSSSCIELHDEPNCGGDFTLLRPGYPHLHDLWFWGIKGSDIAIYAKAVARCGSYCNKTVPEVNPLKTTSPGENMITVFDYSGYYGTPTHIDLSGGVCITFANQTIDTVGSIQTYGQCVTLYMEGNCTERRGSYSLQTGGSKGVEYYLNKIMSSTMPVLRLTKSIQLCRNEGDKVISSPSQTTLKTTQDEEIPSSKTEEQKLQTEGSHQQQDTSDKCSSSSFFSSNWTTALLIFSVLLLMCFSALGGALISRYYDTVNHTTNSERFNVLYKLQS